MSKQNQLLVPSNDCLKNFFYGIEIKELFLVEKLSKTKKKLSIKEVDWFYTEEHNIEIYPSKLSLISFFGKIECDFDLFDRFDFSNIFIKKIITSFQLIHDKYQNLTFELILNDNEMKKMTKKYTLLKIEFSVDCDVHYDFSKVSSFILNIEDNEFSTVFSSRGFSKWIHLNGVLTSAWIAFDSFEEMFKIIPQIKKPKGIDLFKMSYCLENSFKIEAKFERDIETFDINKISIRPTESESINPSKKIFMKKCIIKSNYLCIKFESLVSNYNIILESQGKLRSKHQNVLFSKNKNIFKTLPISKIENFEKSIPNELFHNNERIVDYEMIYNSDDLKIEEIIINKYSIILRKDLWYIIENVIHSITFNNGIGEYVMFKDGNFQGFSRNFNFTSVLDMIKLKKEDENVAKRISYFAQYIDLIKAELNFDSNFLSIFGLFKNTNEVLFRIPLHHRDSFEFYINDFLNSISDVPSFRKDLKIEIHSKGNDLNFIFE